MCHHLLVGVGLHYVGVSVLLFGMKPSLCPIDRRTHWAPASSSSSSQAINYLVRERNRTLGVNPYPKGNPKTEENPKSTLQVTYVYLCRPNPST
jgi:hypothetical protein